MQLFHEPSSILRMVTSQETRSLNFYNITIKNIAENFSLGYLFTSDTLDRQVDHRIYTD